MNQIRNKLSVSQWLNTETVIDEASMQGRVIVVYAFQMLCPSCVINSIPQANQVYQVFNRKDVVVIGLHTVFEHHEAMTAVSLKAFIHEFQIKFPVAIDLPSTSSPIPTTMARYSMRGTPTLLLFDKTGRLRKNHTGHIADLVIGAEIMALISENRSPINSIDEKSKFCDLNGLC
jgi:hypothetical protein